MDTPDLIRILEIWIEANAFYTTDAESINQLRVVSVIELQEQLDKLLSSK